MAFPRLEKVNSVEISHLEGGKGGFALDKYRLTCACGSETCACAEWELLPRVSVVGEGESQPMARPWSPPGTGGDAALASPAALPRQLCPAMGGLVPSSFLAGETEAEAVLPPQRGPWVTAQAENWI